MSSSSKLEPKLYRFGLDAHGGIGTYAATSMSIGTRILVEAPILLVPDMSDPIMLEEILHQQIPQGTKLRSTFFSLVDAHAHPRPSDKTPTGILQSNGYPCHGAKVLLHGKLLPAAGGIFPLFSRFNSSCTPNISHRYDATRNVRSIFAARDIEKGTELTTCYVDSTSPSSVRQSQTLERFGFSCGCDACVGPNAALHDQRRNEISSLDDEIYECIRRGRYDKARTKITRRVEVLEEEGLDTPEMLVRVYNDGYQCCDHAGDGEGALEFMKLMLKDQRLCDDSIIVLNELERTIHKLEKAVY